LGAPGRYHRIGHDAAAIEALFVDLFLEAHRSAPRQIVLDLDATHTNSGWLLRWASGVGVGGPVPG
jgi:hypothetical protein